jgi:predicted ribosomally synthesized peptide with nif11-like leader
MPINKDELTKDMIEKAMTCKTAEELIALAKTGGYELTKEEAESYLAELADIELDGETLKKVSGGVKVCYNVLNCWTKVRNN